MEEVCLQYELDEALSRIMTALVVARSKIWLRRQNERFRTLRRRLERGVLHQERINHDHRFQLGPCMPQSLRLNFLIPRRQGSTKQPLPVFKCHPVGWRLLQTQESNFCGDRAMAARISISLFLIALLLLGTDAMPHALGSQVAAAASASDSEVTMNVVNNETGKIFGLWLLIWMSASASSQAF